MKTKKWICNDIARSGLSLIENEEGELIAEVYNNEDIPLIKSAPDLLRAVKEIRTYLDEEFQTKDKLIPQPIVGVYEIISWVITLAEQPLNNKL